MEFCQSEKVGTLAWLPGGHAWLLGVCMVAGGGWCAWLPGGVVCMVTRGMRDCQGACVVAGGHTWLLGGIRGCRGRRA